ncbi:MAG: carbohydrate kinase, partial [Calditrichaeota bacterium]
MEDVWLIFDFGKTNKKALVFDRELTTRAQFQAEIGESRLEDGLLADDVEAMARWMREVLTQVAGDRRWRLRGVNFTTFGATLVHLDENGQPACPVYSYNNDPGEEFNARFNHWLRSLP